MIRAAVKDMAVARFFFKTTKIFFMLKYGIRIGVAQSVKHFEKNPGSNPGVLNLT